MAMVTKLPASSTKTGADGVSPQPRQEAKNTNDPRGKFGAFLANWLDRHGVKTADLAVDLQVSERTVRKWREGTHGPAFEDLDRVAETLGYADWSLCYAAALRYCAKKKLG
jgi:hypothetical protein